MACLRALRARTLGMGVLSRVACTLGMMESSARPTCTSRSARVYARHSLSNAGRLTQPCADDEDSIAPWQSLEAGGLAGVARGSVVTVVTVSLSR